MKTIRWFVGLAITLSLAKSAFAVPDGPKIEQITGLKGKATGDVFKVSAPREDVKVKVDGVALPPFMGLTSWAAFTEMKHGGTMVMGDIVLFEDEVNAAMSAAFDAGLAVTALHNHFFFDQPKVYFMHIGGEGDLEKLAAGVKAVLSQPREIRGRRASIADSFGKKPPGKNAITPAPIEAVLGKGEAKDGMLKVTIGRTAMMHDTAVAKDMGVNTWAAFAGTDDDAIVDGDFSVTEDELQPVLKSLRGAGINIVAIHQHMTHEQPRIMFLHYWGRGKAVELARGVKEALLLAKHDQ